MIMAARLVRAVVVVVVLLLVLADAAAAQDIDAVFVPERQSELCKGGRVVDPGRLLGAVIDEARVPASLIETVSRTRPPEESPEARVYEDRRHAVTRDHPFGPDSAQFGQRAADAATRLQQIRGSFGTFLGSGGRPAQGYRVIRDGTPVAAAVYIPVDSVFARPARVTIECVTLAARPAVDAKAPDDAAVMNTLTRFRIRGKLEDLGVPRDQLAARAVKPAEISFKRDEEVGGGDTIQLNGILGYELTRSTALEAWHFTLYGWYQRTDLPDASKKSDVDALSVGAHVNTLWKLADTVWLAGSASPEATFDFEQRSETLKLKADASPGFALGAGQVLGGFGDLIGPFAFRPTISGIAELAQVLDEGRNPALEDSEQYFGLGVDLGLKIRLPAVPLLENLVASVDYRHLQLFGASIDKVRRLSASLIYNFNTYVSLKLGYEDGRNVETFQDERYWTISFGVRY
jgi:hypothetical protein